MRAIAHWVFAVRVVVCLCESGKVLRSGAGGARAARCGSRLRQHGKTCSQNSHKFTSQDIISDFHFLSVCVRAGACRGDCGVSIKACARKFGDLNRDVSTYTSVDTSVDYKIYSSLATVQHEVRFRLSLHHCRTSQLQVQVRHSGQRPATQASTRRRPSPPAHL